MPPPLFASLPYVNGALFSEKLGFATFDEKTREALLRCCEFDWANISPAIFGSLFQAVMDSKERRNFGAHYTSESDIMKVIRPLFLDDLERELADCGNRTTALHEFHDKICSLRFLDPACGCGNFLIVAYKHIRRLEHLCLERLQAASTKANRLRHGIGVDPSRMRVAQSQFFGIELSEWAARIAEVALILCERQEDIKLAHAITFRRLPLRHNATIQIGNALELDWGSVLPASECSYILGNPPYVGKKERSDSQRVDMERCWGNTAGVHTLDYVTCWYDRAAHYMRGSSIRAAFVSTKSICQGQQASIMWGNLFGRGLHIHFAHRTFKWRSDSPHAANVSVVIVGFGYDKPAVCHIFDYSSNPHSPARLDVARIDQYLSDSIATPQIKTRQQPLCAVPRMHYGSQAIDQDKSDPEGSGLVVTAQQRKDLLLEEPRLEPYIRPFIGTSELVSGKAKYCLWLKDAPVELLRTSSQLKSRLEHVRAFRMRSKRSQTKRLASTPYLFGGDLQPQCRYLLIPKVSSENRRYLPMAFMPPEVIASGSALVIEEAPEYVFGVLSSAMHMAWLRGVGGRMESRYQYSAEIVYNNFPFPQGVDAGRIESVERAATEVLSARAAAGGVTLEHLYDPLTMPTALVDAHSELDQAVDRCYRRERFESDSARLQHLFDLYQRLATPLTSESPKRRRAKAKPGNTILE